MTAQAIHGSTRRAEAAATVMKALGHPLRLQIVSLLAEEEQHVGAIAELLDAAPAIVSQQLRILRMAGLVETSRDEGRAVYRLAEPHLRGLLACMGRCLRVRTEE
jgi:ArsR family transcriptional regulator